MRRGKINKLSYFLIILSAIFTVLSYVSDQVVIRFENDLRMKNIVYQDLDTKIKSLESASTKLENLQIQSNDVINNELLQRNFWIKNLFIIESKKEYFKEMPVPEILTGLKFAKSRWHAKDAGTLKVGRKSIVQKEVHSVTTEQAQWRLKNWKMMISNYRRRGYSYPTISRIKKILIQKSKKKSK